MARNILVVEDDRNISELIQMYLVKEGFEVRIAGDGGRAIEEFEKAEPENSVCILGNNTANSAKLQIGVRKPQQRLIANNNCGSMGADLPEAVGAAVAGRDVICVTGDGSIMMNLQELQTIQYNKLPVKVIVFSNDGYNAIRQTSLNFFNGFFVGCNEESGISFPSFEKVADTFGYQYRCCHTNAEVAECLKWLFEQEGQVLLLSSLVVWIETYFKKRSLTVISFASFLDFRF